jgi:hypothetical protein
VLAAIAVGLLVAIGYLTFLWFADPTRPTWKVIILPNRAATSLVICAVAIRWLSGFQMMLCTSILAWNVLKEGTWASKIPRLSSLRYNNAGPSDFTNSPHPWSKSSFHPHLFTTIILSVLTIILLQFSSTLLLSDLATGPVHSFATALLGLSFLIFGTRLRRGDYRLTLSRPQSRLIPSLRKAHNIIGLSRATPLTIQGLQFGLYPVLAHEGRSKLLSFDGNAALYNARCICTQPLLSLNKPESYKGNVCL